MQIKAIVDRESCLGYGDCAELAPEAFEVGDTAEVIGDAPEKSLRAAASACPAEAITLIDAETGEEIR